MKVNEKRIFPYPVFRKESEDYKEVIFNVNTELYYNSDIATIQFLVEINDNAIFALLENNQVGLFAHVECSKTKYREMFEIDAVDKGMQSIDIPLQKLNGDIEIICFLVAKEEITGFKDDNLSEFYTDENVRFPQYSRIGYSEPFETKIVKHLDVNGEVPSIFSVVADDSIDYMSFEVGKSKIMIYLPENEHTIYTDYLGVDPKTKLMMINLSVLTEIIAKTQVQSAEYEEYDWFEVLREAFAKKGFNDLDSSSFKGKPAVELAQIIIPDLCKNAFKEFDKSHTKGDA